MRALIRRAQPVEKCLHTGDLIVDSASRQVSRGGRSISVTRTEFELLELLARQAGRVVSRRELIDAAWGTGTTMDENNLEVMISSLRQRVDKRTARAQPVPKAMFFGPASRRGAITLTGWPAITSKRWDSRCVQDDSSPPRTQIEKRESA